MQEAVTALTLSLRRAPDADDVAEWLRSHFQDCARKTLPALRIVAERALSSLGSPAAAPTATSSDSDSDSDSDDTSSLEGVDLVEIPVRRVFSPLLFIGSCSLQKTRILAR